MWVHMGRGVFMKGVPSELFVVVPALAKPALAPPGFGRLVLVVCDRPPVPPPKLLTGFLITDLDPSTVY